MSEFRKGFFLGACFVLALLWLAFGVGALVALRWSP